MLKIIANPDREQYLKITNAIKDNDGKCCCIIQPTKCMCDYFKNQNKPGPCICGRFIKIEVPDVVYPTTMDEWR